jgi:dephospho-CoA kinase
MTENCMEKKQVIGIIGEQAGGKGAAADIIRKHYGGLRLTVSSMLRRTLESLHLEPTRENLIDIALVLKKVFGDPVLMEAMVKEVELTDADLVIVDGFRMPGDPDPFRREYGDSFKLIYVTADQKLRYERSVNRGEKAGEDEATFEDFKANEAKATEAKIAEVGKTADFKIENNAGVEELEEAIIKVLSKI